MKDAHQRAGQVVDALYDNWKRLPSNPEVTERQIEDALAAAIGVARDAHGSGQYAECDCCDCDALREALSALGVEVEQP